MRSSSLLITLSGLDGAGKSTVAKKLQDYFLSHDGRKSKYVWCKYGETPFDFLHLSGLSSHKSTNSERYSPRSRQKENILSARQVYLLLLLLLHILKIYFRVYLPWKKGGIVICDRYIYDTLTDLRQQNYQNLVQAQALLKRSWIPKPDFQFFLQLSESNAIRRKTDTSSEEFLGERRCIYSEIAKEYCLEIIDASQSPDVVFRTILEKITEQR